MQPIQHHRSRHHRLYEIIIIATLVVLVTFSLYCLTKSWDVKDSELLVADDFWSISWPRLAWVAVIGQGRAQHRVIEIYRRNQRGAATEDKIWEAKAAIRVGVLIKPGSPSLANGSLSLSMSNVENKEIFTSGDVDLLRRESVEIHGSWEISQPRSGLASVQLLTAQGLYKWFFITFYVGKNAVWLTRPRFTLGWSFYLSNGWVSS